MALESCREIQKFPRKFKAFREMCGEGFDAECLGRVMAAEEKIDSELFRRDRGPMWRFPGDERVDVGFRDTINLRASGAGDDSNASRFFRPEVETLHRTAKDGSRSE